MSSSQIDPITFRIIWGRLVGFVEQAGATLRHSAFSSIVSEGNDCTAVLFDAVGRELAEPVSFTATSFIGTVPRTMKIFLERFPPETWNPGDILICNDPWICTGHLFDICLVVPIFFKDKLVGFSVTCSHTTDIGGGNRTDARSIFEEGIRIPMCWLFRKGEPQEVVYDFIRANVPEPSEVLGDIGAQVGANRGMAQRVVEFLEEAGLDDLRPIADAIAETSHQAMRKMVLEIPSGRYVYDLNIDSLDEAILIRCALEVPGDGRLKLDFTGTSDQVRKAINSPLHYTLARAFYTIKACLLPDTPGNEASFRDFEVVAPPGCIVNSIFPYPNASRNVIGHFVPTAVMGALSQAIPDRVLAECAGAIWAVGVSGENEHGERYRRHILLGTGQGASAQANGMDAVTFPGNPANTPVEILERGAPLRFVEKSLLRESGGRGEQRGGWGQRAVIEITGAIPQSVSVRAARTEIPASGLAGGEPGAVGNVRLNGKPVSQKQFTPQPGDRIEVETPGGGGFGRPTA